MTELLNRYTPAINTRLKELFLLEHIHPTLRDSMYYSVNAGGKRFRPTLNILGNALLGGNMDETLDVACALELIHTYSLIHDDLPAMDNDELRRGKPTNHIMFGEAFAILAGDGLLNYAFEIMLQNALNYPHNMAAHVRAMREVATGAGVGGMINGQCADIENEGQILTAAELDYTHRHKTGDLIKSSLVSGLLLCNPSDAQVDALATYGYSTGLVFQIVDDILDVTGSEKVLGKSIGKDQKSKKFTYPTLYGVDGSMKIATEKAQEAADSVAVFGANAQPLVELATWLLERDR